MPNAIHCASMSVSSEGFARLALHLTKPLNGQYGLLISQKTDPEPISSQLVDHWAGKAESAGLELSPKDRQIIMAALMDARDYNGYRMFKFPSEGE